ncbi:TlpA family protein disulfide reductase [Simiduia aestuariiviva]|uniref:Thiol-disulfide isomerase/thioredoxin n=1 Tax=Simiduia aestuariiviva TaxID=1510459 RepID=A0A839UTM7_9GAMM|nr:TlpA disulfide reductase family protein [Simiduia aestuariiviva]MBB3169779.1 thiol-disulfide isomerase/thioredoxin [Simiduia aestuariiviva]
MKYLLLSFALFIGGLSHATEPLSGPAPDFTLKSRDGKNIRLSDLRGQVIMLNFWASWCGPCRQEMPLLDELSKRYSRAGFTLLGVNVEQDTAAGEKYLQDTPVSFPILWDPTSTVSKLYNIDAMPSTVMIDRDGNMRYLHRGYKPGYEKDYKKQIKELIRE